MIVRRFFLPEPFGAPISKSARFPKMRSRPIPLTIIPLPSFFDRPDVKSEE